MSDVRDFWLGTPRRAPARLRLVRLTNLMDHRGPDGSEYWQGDTAGWRHQISFGHKRPTVADRDADGQSDHSHHAERSRRLQ
jgi:asparagine synthetase B (glutamine-hydrolysing)